MLEAEDQEIESGLLDRENGGVGDERRLHRRRRGSVSGVDRFHGTHADDGCRPHRLFLSQKHERAICRAVVGRSGEVCAEGKDAVDALQNIAGVDLSHQW